MIFRLLQIAALLAACSFTGCAAAVEAPSSHPLSQLAGGKARVAWIRQVVGEGDDPLARGENFSLMGLDTHDGAGARQVLSEVGNYWKPMLTPDGQHIVYSDYTALKVYVVDWDGTNHRELLSGALAVDVWREPDADVVWVYSIRDLTTGEVVDGKTAYRCRLDRPEVSELVWDQSSVTDHNFQLSADGTRAAGLFPWPEAGLAEVPNGGLRKTGKGCWTSLAPDNSYMMWVFDGAHRNVYLKIPGALFSRKIRLNSAPGTEGFEVYHPRWSNHVRYMAMSGPYRVMGKHNAVTGGGKGINLYVGRFDEDFNRIEAWAQVTDADEGDFFPDLWIEGGDASRVGDLAVEMAPEMPEIAAWPASHEGLVYVWENASSEGVTEVLDAEGNGVRACKVERRGHTVFGPAFDADLRRGALEAKDIGAALADACGKANVFSLEFTLQPAGRRPREAVILANAGSVAEGNVAVIERNKEVFLRVATDEQPFASASDVHMFRLRPQRANHVVITYRSGELAYYLNGEPLATFHDVTGGLSSWTAMPLFFGALPGGAGDWPGSIEGIAVYSRVLSAGEVQAHWRHRLTSLKARTTPARFVLEAKLAGKSTIPTVKSIEPYRASLVEYKYDVEKVLEGDFPDDALIVRHWCILDAETLPLGKDVGEIYPLTVEKDADHPELEGERVSVWADDPLLDVYLDVGWK